MDVACSHRVNGVSRTKSQISIGAEDCDSVEGFVSWGGGGRGCHYWFRARGEWE